MEVDTKMKTSKFIPSDIFAQEYKSLVDFCVEVPEGRNARVLQLTDTQIIESEKQRYEGRVGKDQYDFWRKDNKEENFKNYVRQLIGKYKPDLIIVTGDLVYGEFDDDGSALLDFIAFMDSFEIPWAPTFGNHEPECTKGVDWQCEQLENSPYCLFKQRNLTGNGNYTVGILQGGASKRIFFMMDSNGYITMSEATAANGHSVKEAGFKADQIEWYTEAAISIKKVSPDAKFSFAFHIAPHVFIDSLKKYGVSADGSISEPIDLDAIGEQGDYGYLGKSIPSEWDRDYTFWNSIKAIGNVDSIFVGHEHTQSVSVMYEGVRLQYGTKSSVYDSTNYIIDDGSMIHSYTYDGKPIVGGNAIDISRSDGSLADTYIILV